MSLEQNLCRNINKNEFMDQEYKYKFLEHKICCAHKKIDLLQKKALRIMDIVHAITIPHFFIKTTNNEKIGNIYKSQELQYGLKIIVDEHKIDPQSESILQDDLSHKNKFQGVHLSPHSIQLCMNSNNISNNYNKCDEQPYSALFIDNKTHYEETLMEKETLGGKNDGKEQNIDMETIEKVRKPPINLISRFKYGYDCPNKSSNC